MSDVALKASNWLPIALFVVLLAFASWAGVKPAGSAEWPIEAMNKAIEQTNFAVDGHCSGTLIDLPERLVLTNWHCIENRIEIVEEEITAPDGFQRKIKRKRYHDVPVTQDSFNGYTRVRTTSNVSMIVAEDKKRDLALLQIQGDIQQTYASPMLPWDGVIARGERIYTVGNPAMFESSVFEGIVSNVNRTFEFPWTGGEKTPMIQFSGGIVGGNSGGALYNGKGQLVGVPSAGSSRSDILGLAIPISTVKKFLSDNCWIAPGDQTIDGVVNAAKQVYRDPKCVDAKAKKAEKAEKAK